MAKFLTTTGLSHHIENIINKAKINLYLVSPYLKISNNFLERLKDASAKGVSITIAYGKTELKDSERTLLKQIPNLHVFYLERLHAKCYFNEFQMVITSMNMYEFSEKNNREMGVLIDIENDNEIFEDARNETLSIIKHSGLKLKSDVKPNVETVDLNIQITNNKNKKFVPTIGNCINCKSQIKYDLGNPFCKECKITFPDSLENPYKEGDFCHRCGKHISVSFHKPECKTCTIESYKPKEFSGFLLT